MDNQYQKQNDNVIDEIPVKKAGGGLYVIHETHEGDRGSAKSVKGWDGEEGREGVDGGEGKGEDGKEGAGGQAGRQISSAELADQKKSKIDRFGGRRGIGGGSDKVATNFYNIKRVNGDSHGKPKIEDIKYKQKLTGPVEEIGALKIKDFRHLSSDPKKAIEMIKDKIDLLEEDDFKKKLEGIKAFRESGLYKAYLVAGETRMNANVNLSPLKATTRQRTNQREEGEEGGEGEERKEEENAKNLPPAKGGSRRVEIGQKTPPTSPLVRGGASAGEGKEGKNDLTEEEFYAIMDLNKQLRF